MALNEFLENVRSTAPLVFPDFWLDPTQEPVVDVGWAASLANVWLTPAVVDTFSPTDFAFLPPDQHVALVGAVGTMARGAGERFDPTAGSPPQAMCDAARAFATVLKIVWPHLQGDEGAAARQALAAATHGERAWIPAFDFLLSEAWDGEPSIHVWLILSDEVNVEEPIVQNKLAKVRDGVRAALKNAGVGRWPYISVRSVSEVRELAEMKA